MLEFNQALTEIERRLRKQYPLIDCKTIPSAGKVHAEGDGCIVNDLVLLMIQLMARHTPKACLLETGVGSIGEVFLDLGSNARAGYAYLAAVLQFEEEVPEPSSPFVLQGSALVRTLAEEAEAHGGFVQLESKSRNTLRVVVRMPSAQLGAGETEIAMSPTGKTILLVEDEEFVRTVTREVLEMEGYKVLSAANATEALKLFEEEGYFDLLLTDVVLPGMNGRDLAARLLPKVEELRVIFMSGYSDTEALRGGIEGVPSHYLQKPFTLDTLIGRVREVIASPEPLAIAQALHANVVAQWNEVH